MENALQPPVSHEIATWKETILGVLPILTPFLVFSLQGPGSGLLSFLVLLILPIIGILVVVRSDYWGWFWTYVSLIAFDFLFIMQPGFPTGIVAISWSVWLLRAATILLVVFIVYFLVKLQHRLTIRPPADFDMLNFLLLTVFIVQYFILAAYEGISAVFQFPYPLLCDCILALGVVVYLRTPWRWLRGLSLLGAFVLALYITKAVTGTF